MINILKGRLVLVRITLLIATLALVGIGVATIYAVGSPAEESPAGPPDNLQIFWKKQLVFAVIGLMAFVFVNLVNYRRFGELSYWLYAGVLVLLGALLIDRFVNLRIGNFVTIPVKNGTRRWIALSLAGQSISIQPSELCKIVYIMALAWYLRYRSNYRRFKALIGPFALTVLPMVLILLEPDLGTVMLMMPVLFTMLFVAGAKVKHFALIVLMALLVSPLLWLKMEPYQRERISSVVLQSSWVRQKAQESPFLARLLVGGEFNERLWKNDWGYHLIRSKYAVASGGANGGLGHGFRKGPFIKYDFLPERHNDFIFAAIAHQWGLWGSLLLFGLYATIITCGLEIAVGNTDPFGRLLAVGIVAMFAVEVVVNVGMTTGLMPITGLTLPFVSYGGSSLLVSLAAIGLLNNVGRCRPFTLARKTQATLNFNSSRPTRR